MMQTGNTKIVTKVEVEFSEKEWMLLEGGTDRDYPPAEYIHDATIRSLNRRKKKVERKAKKDVQP